MAVELQQTDGVDIKVNRSVQTITPYINITRAMGPMFRWSTPGGTIGVWTENTQPQMDVMEISSPTPPVINRETIQVIFW